MVVVLIGVAGAGKTTVGQLLSRDLGWEFFEGDDYHPAANVEKLREGVPLTDADRLPWLAKVRAVIERCLEQGQDAVVTCSALKKKYRDYLRVGPTVKFVYLRGSYSRVERQLRSRRGHFMNPRLLRSQFADLEDPAADAGVVVVELGRAPLELVKEIELALKVGG